MLALIGIQGGLGDTKARYAMSALFHNAGVKNIRVNPTHTNLVFVEYDEHQLCRVDIINRITQIGLNGSVCGC